MHEYISLTLAAIGLAGAACQWLAWWVKLPAILFLLLAGILAGPLFGLLDPDALFGELLLPVVSLAVAVILFEGSLTLRFKEIQGLEQVVRRLVSIGLLATWGATTLAVHWILDFTWEMAFLFGAVTVVTGPTVIVPMLRTVRPNARLSNILRWEGIFIDPVGALLATWGSELNWRERMLLAWIAPRGIVAAAVSALFALRLSEQGVEGAGLLVPLTFIVIIGTVTLQSATARILANWLGVAEPEPKGFLIVGANSLARAIAEALCGLGYRALLADAKRENIREARMLGLSTWYGDPVSGKADRSLDLVGIGHLLALSPRPEVNSLAC